MSNCPLPNRETKMTTDNARLGAYLLALGYPILRLSTNERGFVEIEFPEEAAARGAEYANDAPIPVRTYATCYASLMRTIRQHERDRQLQGARSTT